VDKLKHWLRHMSKNRSGLVSDRDDRWQTGCMITKNRLEHDAPAAHSCSSSNLKLYFGHSIDDPQPSQTNSTYLRQYKGLPFSGLNPLQYRHVHPQICASYYHQSGSSSINPSKIFRAPTTTAKEAKDCK